MDVANQCLLLAGCSPFATDSNRTAVEGAGLNQIDQPLLARGAGRLPLDAESANYGLPVYFSRETLER